MATDNLRAWGIVRGQYRAFLDEEGIDDSQTAAERFATRKTSAGGEKHLGFSELQIIERLGWERPIGYDG